MLVEVCLTSGKAEIWILFMGKGDLVGRKRKMGKERREGCSVDRQTIFIFISKGSSA